ncbi:MAG: hypothetical protein ACK559_17905, partial [bacterium]
MASPLIMRGRSPAPGRGRLQVDALEVAVETQVEVQPGLLAVGDDIQAGGQLVLHRAGHRVGLQLQLHHRRLRARLGRRRRHRRLRRVPRQARSRLRRLPRERVRRLRQPVGPRRR